MARRRWVIYGPAGEGAFAESYREQVEAHVRRLTDDIPGLSKLKRGETLTELDLEGIARALNQADLFITEDVLREVYQQPSADYRTSCGIFWALQSSPLGKRKLGRPSLGSLPNMAS